MAWSFKKKIRIAPGVSLNLSKSGISTSIGPKGAKVTVGPKGTYLYTGIPGTGLYNRQKVGPAPQSENTPSSSNLFESSSYESKSRSSSFEGYGVDMNMDRTGRVTFSFTDNYGYPVTNEATIQKLIRKVKALPFYKDRLAELTKMTFDEVNGDTEAFTDLYKKTPQIKTDFDVNTALDQIVLKCYTPLPFDEECPQQESIRQTLMGEAEDKIHSLLWWKNKPAREQYVEENTPLVYKQLLREWEQRRDEFISQQNDTKKQKDAEYLKEYLEERKPLEAFFSRDEGEIIDALHSESIKIEEVVPGDFGLNFHLDLEYGVLYVELDLPEVEEIPKDKAVYLPSGNVSFKQKTTKEIQLDYVKCICGLAFYVAGRFFNVNSSIEHIQVSGYTQRITKATGVLDNEYVYSVFFDKESFSILNVEYIDPVEAIYEFPVRIKASVTGVLTTITPFTIPGRNDKDRGVFPQKEVKNKPTTEPKPITEPIEELDNDIVIKVENADRINELNTEKDCNEDNTE